MKLLFRILLGVGLAFIGAAIAFAYPAYGFACGWVSACLFVLITGQWRNIP